jgi:hypothetical protein
MKFCHKQSRDGDSFRQDSGRMDVIGPCLPFPPTVVPNLGHNYVEVVWAWWEELVWGDSASRRATMITNATRCRPVTVYDNRS